MLVKNLPTFSPLFLLKRGKPGVERRVHGESMKWRNFLGLDALPAVSIGCVESVRKPKRRLKIRSPQGGVGSSPTFGSKDLRRFAVSLFFGLLHFFCTRWDDIAVAMQHVAVADKFRGTGFVKTAVSLF